jgi:hypothetical protein
VDVHYFLQSRLVFLRRLYQTTASPYIERKKLIDVGEEPYGPNTSEDNEPPYLSEWLEADQSLRVLGQMFISALASTLQLYLKESVVNVSRRVGRQKVNGLRPIKEYSKVFKNEGWLTGYATYFLEEFDINFESSKCDMGILNGLVLARNRSQHPDSITTLDVRHAENDLKKVPSLFFASKREMELFGNEPFPSFFYMPTVTATETHIDAAIKETERFCEWLEAKIWEWSAA